MKTGDIVYVMHHDNRLSRLIAWFMKSKWSHSAIVIGSDRKRHYLCETSDFEVTLGSLERYMDDPRCSVEIWTPKALSNGARKEVSDRAVTHVGRMYPYLQLLTFALRNGLRRFGIKIPNLFTRGYTCNQNWLEGYTQTHGSPFVGMDCKQLDTQETYDIMKNSGHFELVLSKDANG